MTKVHLEAVRFARDGFSIVLIGHKDHDEVIGTLGEVPERSYLVETVDDVDKLELPDPGRVRYLTQTTLSLDETRDIITRLKERFPLSSTRPCARFWTASFPTAVSTFIPAGPLRSAPP